MKSIFMNSVFRVILRASFCLIVAASSFDATAALNVPPPPTINARAYILMDYDSGQILADSKAEERMEPASLTKLMTSYVIYKEMRDGRIKLHDMVTISEHAWRMGGSRTFVPVGKKVSVEDLLKGMIVQSGNDATVALAEYVGGSESVFVSLMNQEAKQLGMTPLHFGIMMVLNLCIGLCTPPVGSILFVGCGIGRTTVGRTTRALLPFYAVMVLVLMLVVYIPWLTQALPGMLGY